MPLSISGIRGASEAGAVPASRPPESPRRHTAQQVTEFGVGVTIKALREIAGRKIRPTHLSFLHARNSDLREFEAFFGCPVEFGASGDQVAFSNETLALPLVTEDRHLLETLRPICDEAAKERGTAIGSLRAAVENEAQKLLPHGKAKRHRVAKSLGHSERTLTRKLADEGTTPIGGDRPRTSRNRAS
jgi:hypothetical protein